MSKRIMKANAIEIKEINKSKMIINQAGVMVPNLSLFLIIEFKLLLLNIFKFTKNNVNFLNKLFHFKKINLN
jgi:ATP-dependent protease HslVU (ClpYQ) peptidase subunit